MSPTVYPRWRGEHTQKASTKAALTGLSPLARGTPEHKSLFFLNNRFIPAGAGNTIECIFNSRIITVYPRWRGEHIHGGNFFCAVVGLSPLARGTPHSERRAVTPARFIPAGAGNTLARALNRNGPAVYPRWRGEHPRFSTPPQVENGLSPLARGTRIL